ncbi:MAG: type II toxin-antitoxin system VapC family toxin [Chloroflexota bacterium]
MSIVVDANLVIAVVLPLPYSEHAWRMMSTWKQARETLYAPVLWEYEAANTLRKASVAGLLSTAEATNALQRMLALNIQSVQPTLDLHQDALKWAERLGQSRAYDAHYIALAQSLGAAFWTGDKRLANSMQHLGANWVYWVQDETGG